MNETLKQIALPLFHKHINKHSRMETDADEVMEFVNALVAALGAQEPVAVIQGYFAQNDYATVVVSSSVVNGQQLYAAPVVKEDWQMVTTEELTRLREIAKLIGSIFVHGNFKAETYNERALEKLLRENGTFFESLADFDAAAPEYKP